VIYYWLADETGELGKRQKKMPRNYEKYFAIAIAWIASLSNITEINF
jgi:hypothetical protein